MKNGIIAVKPDGTVIIPGGYAARIAPGAFGNPLPFPLAAAVDNDLPVIFLDSGVVPLNLKRIDGASGWPPLILGGALLGSQILGGSLTPGTLVAYQTAETLEEARSLSAGVALSLAAPIPSSTGQLAAVTDTPVMIAAPGGSLATVRVSTAVAGTVQLTAEVSVDGLSNWIPAVYGKRLDLTAANPSVVPFVNFAPAKGSVYEFALPGTSTWFRLRPSVAGTASTVTVAGGAPFVSGVPVVGVLYDVTEGAIGAGLPATGFDLTGWTGLNYGAATPTGQPAVIKSLDDLGNPPPGGGAQVVVTAAVLWAAGGLGLGAILNSINHTANLSAFGSSIGLPKRIQTLMLAGGTVTQGRIRLEARR